MTKLWTQFQMWPQSLAIGWRSAAGLEGCSAWMTDKIHIPTKEGWRKLEKGELFNFLSNEDPEISFPVLSLTQHTFLLES